MDHVDSKSSLLFLMRFNGGFEYEVNGCDIAIRKCPRCMWGIKYEECVERMEVADIGKTIG